MSKRFSSIETKELPLIIPILAVISIIIYSLFPQFSAAEAQTYNTKTKESQVKPDYQTGRSDSLENLSDNRKMYSNSADSLIIIQQNSVLSQNNHEILAVSLPAEQAEKKNEILLVKIETEETIVPKRKMWVLATAYSSTVDQCDSTPFITANGTYVHDGTLAANFLPFGAKVRFPSLYGEKTFTVEDRMKSDQKVDLWFPTREEAKNFGVKRLEMEIL